MSVMTRNQAVSAKAKGARIRHQAQARSAPMRHQAQARGAGMRHQAQAAGAQFIEQAARSAAAKQARRTAARLAPVAMGLGLATQRGVYSARVWAAPQLEHAARTVQSQLAPRAAELLLAASRQVQPPARRRRFGWPAFAAGSILLAGGGAAAVFLLTRRNGDSYPAARHSAETSPGEPESASADSPSGQS